MDCLKCPIFLTHNAHCGPAPKYLSLNENRKTSDCAMLSYDILLPIFADGPSYDEVLQWVADNIEGDWSAYPQYSVISFDKSAVIQFQLQSDASLFKLTFC